MVPAGEFQGETTFENTVFDPSLSYWSSPEVFGIQEAVCVFKTALGPCEDPLLPAEDSVPAPLIVSMLSCMRAPEYDRQGGTPRSQWVYAHVVNLEI